MHLGLRGEDAADDLSLALWLPKTRSIETVVNPRLRARLSHRPGLRSTSASARERRDVLRPGAAVERRPRELPPGRRQSARRQPRRDKRSFILGSPLVHAAAPSCVQRSDEGNPVRLLAERESSGVVVRLFWDDAARGHEPDVVVEYEDRNEKLLIDALPAARPRPRRVLPPERVPRRGELVVALTPSASSNPPTVSGLSPSCHGSLTSSREAVSLERGRRGPHSATLVSAARPLTRAAPAVRRRELSRSIRAGFPTTTVRAGTSFVTTAPAPTNASSPISTPGHRIAPPPMRAPRRIVGPGHQLVAALGAAHEVVVRGDDAGRDEHVLLERRVRGDVGIRLDPRARPDGRVVLDERAAADDDVLGRA